MDEYHLGLAAAAVLGLAALLFAWSRALRARVEARTVQLDAQVAALTAEIAERRRREETALRETDTRLQLSIRASNIGLWDWNPSDGRVYFSPEYKRQLGYGDDEIAGHYREWESRLHPDDKPRVLATLQAFLEQPGLDYENEFRLRHKDGSYRWIYARGEILRDAEGKPYRVLGCHVDVTERKQVEAALAAEHNLLRSLIDHVPEAIVVKDLALRFLAINQEGARRLGVSRTDDVIGRRVGDFLSARTAEAVEREDREVIRSGQPILDLQRQSHNDRINALWISVSKIPLRDAEGRVSGLLAINRDMTPLKQAADELARERNLLRSIIDHAPEGIYVKDVEGRYLAINPESLHRLGASRVEDVVGRTVGEFLPAAAAGRIEREDRAVMQSGRPLIGERRPISSIGSERWASISKVPLRDGEGKVTGLLTLSHDITDLQRALEQVRGLNVELEERVRLRTAELEEANRELEAFSYSVSHDLRAPLRRVSGFLQILRKAAHDRLSDEERGTMQRIAAAVQRMDQLIEDMLHLARVAAQEMRVSDVDLSALAESVAADLRGSHPAHDVTVVVAPGIQAQADPRLMRIVLENLLGNAWKFTGRSAAPRIEFGLDADAGEPAYYVRDNGAGFDMKHAARLFGAFQRLHHVEEFPGTGIGLVTVARIVRRHGGRVWADARPDQGATFYFTLATH